MKSQRTDHGAACPASITRRDFIGATLVGAGAALLHAPSPADAQELGSAWTGYGGVGDYRFSNGNTAEVVSSAHKVRDAAYAAGAPSVIDTGELFDVVIVGGGFAGLTALYEFRKRKPAGSCLLLDNHPIFGGFAKSNEFDVDGYRVAGPQASINFSLPKATPGKSDDYWHELGLPAEFQFAPQQGGDRSIVFPRGTSGPLYFGEQCATVGYYFEDSSAHSNGTWVKDIWKDDLQRAPWPDAFKKELLALRERKAQYASANNDSAWLDSITFADLVTKIMGLSADVLPYMTPAMGVGGHSPQVSAYAARYFPGLDRFPSGSAQANSGDRWMSFPGGNATILRHFVKAALPEAIEGPGTFEAIANNPVNLSALDRPDSKCRMRLSATVIKVSHEGDPGSADRVTVVYEKAGRLYRAKARGAVLAIGSWVARRIVGALPDDYRAAFQQFLYQPILMVNVALRNWRFLDKLGFSAARWFDGFGFFGTIRQPMLIGDRPVAFHPDKPIVMTIYAPIQHPDLPLEAQGPAGRAELYRTSYADYEQQIVSQLQRLFSSGGFDARRDIAGIVLNRWGHAMPSPAPGFFFGKDGKPPPRQVLRERVGRIAFGHSELGSLDWEGATTEGRRAITQVVAVL
jgi:spermidine dehydrogenase